MWTQETVWNSLTASGFCRTSHLGGRGSQTRSTWREKLVFLVTFLHKLNITKWISVSKTNLIVIWTVGRLFHRGILLLIPDLHAHHGIHVQADQLPGFNHWHAHLKSGHRLLVIHGQCYDWWHFLKLSSECPVDRIVQEFLLGNLLVFRSWAPSLYLVWTCLTAVTHSESEHCWCLEVWEGHGDKLASCLTHWWWQLWLKPKR